jgi:hypothetical protein
MRGTAILARALDPLSSGSRIAENPSFSPHIAVIGLAKLLANPVAKSMLFGP